MVVADLSSQLMTAALRGGVDVLKTSDEDLQRDGLLDGGATDADVVRVARKLQCQGDGCPHIVISRGAAPVLVLADDLILWGQAPVVTSVDAKGAGDSLTASIAACLAGGDDFVDALRIGLAAATLNVARRGLATGQRDAIMRMAEHVRLEPTSETTP